ncbi:MAG: M23 family metallopeptidase [Treponema sp.]|jgi:murein DD-endopeptidase MepM/ murein hydrolase activator NlpD|nr:M23 family metallopeptidase [Treponema sp.]
MVLWLGKGSPLPFFVTRSFTDAMRIRGGGTGILTGSRRFRFLFLFLFLVLSFPLRSNDGAEPSFPRINRLNQREDPVFRQYLEDMNYFRQHYRRMDRDDEENLDKANSSPTDAGIMDGLTIYTYVPQKGDDFLFVAARCMIPFGALATLNRLANSDALESAGILLIPSVPGLFIPENPVNNLERLLDSGRTGGVTVAINRDGSQERFRFLPGEDFSSTERAFFLNPGRFIFPLKTYRLTSAFGPRINPVTGNPRNHQGLDLAAPLGTDVFAVRDGVVADQGEDPVYGKYIILQHADNWASLYGHLSGINTVLRSRVQSGTIIGKVGSTGQSTGPHLHFELRQHGIAQDPGKYLFQEGGRR